MTTLRKSQYERHFKKWGFHKNKKKNVWEVIAHKVTKRQRDNKESEVWIGFDMVPPKKIRQEVSRYGYEAAFSHGFHGNYSFPRCSLNSEYRILIL